MRRESSPGSLFRARPCRDLKEKREEEGARNHKIKMESKPGMRGEATPPRGGLSHYLFGATQPAEACLPLSMAWMASIIF